MGLFHRQHFYVRYILVCYESQSEANRVVGSTLDAWGVTWATWMVRFGIETYNKQVLSNALEGYGPSTQQR